MSSDSLENVIKKMCLQIIYIYVKDLALNNLQWLICHKSKLINKKIFKNQKERNKSRPT